MLKTTTLWQISVTTSRQAEEAVAALLERLFGQPASVYLPEDKDLCVATVYCRQKSAQLHSKRAALEAGLTFLSHCDLDLGEAKIFIGKVPREDWTTSWKKYFKTLEFGSALLIKPSWSKRRPRTGQSVVTLDPGLSFGTGQHPTTAFCLKQLVEAHKTGQLQSFLDIGTGSGILAIAAAKLGYRPVVAFDNDPVAVRVAKNNARKNRVAPRLTIKRQDLTRLPASKGATYDLVCANLMAELLIEHSARVLNRLARTGRLVLAGILERQFAEVQRAYEHAGLLLQTTRVEGEWKSGAFVFSS